MHLLDTDTLTHLLAGQEAIVRRLSRLEDPEVGTTVVTKIELLRGRFDFLLKAASGREVQRAQGWLSKTERLLGDVLVVPFDTQAAEHFDRLRNMPGLRRHFRPIPGLTVENWID